jgi:hypothetical protein
MATAERALGGLQSGTLIPVFGACFTNNSGAALAGPAIGYTGEEWRLGAAGRLDRLDFQFSTNATSLNTGTWIRHGRSRTRDPGDHNHGREG